MPLYLLGVSRLKCYNKNCKVILSKLYAEFFFYFLFIFLMINGPCEGPWLYAVLLLSLPVTLRSVTWILNFCIKFLCFKFLMNV